MSKKTSYNCLILLLIFGLLFIVAAIAFHLFANSFIKNKLTNVIILFSNKKRNKINCLIIRWQF
jgi:hypothetical protein